MNEWLPVVGTLSGAIVAGIISILVSWRSNRNAMLHTKLTLAEDRARWAVERRLESLQQFYRTIEQLLDATEQIRIQEVWTLGLKEEGIPIPDWVLSPGDARERFETAVRASSSQTLFLDLMCR
jgi:hypothetical protein